MSGGIPFLSAVTSLFACLLVLGLVVGGLVFMVAPSVGREIFKTIGIAAGLFIAGSLLFQAFYFAAGQIANLVGFLYRLIGLVASIALVVRAFLYPFDQKEALTFLKKVGLALVGLLFLPVVFIELARALNPTILTLALILVPLAAYWVRQYRIPRREPPQRPHRPERTPGLPRGGPRS